MTENFNLLKNILDSTHWLNKYKVMNPANWNFRKEMARAIQEKDYKAAKKLLDEGFDVDTEIMMVYKYPIELCIKCDSLEIAQLLIDRGCSLSLNTPHGSSPLLHAAVNNLSFDFVNLFLNNKIDTTITDLYGKTALHIAAQLNSLRIVQLLVEKAHSRILHMEDKSGKTAFSYACSYGNEDLISYFLSKGCDVNKSYGYNGNTPLLDAISSVNCSVAKITMLLDAGANVNYVNNCRESPLLKAIHSVECRNSGGFFAARDRLYCDICSLLIDRGSEVNIQNTLGDTPLHYAVNLREETLVHKLLNAGSDVNIPNSLGQTPIFIAIKNANRTIIRLLIKSGAIFSSNKWISREQKLLLNCMFAKSLMWPSLKDLCRFVIRRHLHRNINDSAQLLPLPLSLVKFIKLVE